MKLLKRLFREEEGAGILEYALLVFFIALVAMVGITTFGTQLNNFFSTLWPGTLPQAPS